MPETTKVEDTEITQPERSVDPAVAEKSVNQQAEQAATRAQETIKRYDTNHNIFTK